MMIEIDVAAAGAAPRQERVTGILSSAEQYQESAIGPLEDHLAFQVSSGTYDFAANKALVKLYKFTPARCRSDMLAPALAKAMMARDSTALLYMVPDALLEATPLLRRLGKCDALLETSQFAAFWECAREDDAALVALVPGFTSALRRYILGLLASTFENVHVSLVAETLGMTLDDAAALVANPPPGTPLLASSDPALARFKPNAHNQPRQVQYAKTVQLDTLLALAATDGDFSRSKDVAE